MYRVGEYRVGYRTNSVYSSIIASLWIGFLISIIANIREGEDRSLCEIILLLQQNYYFV